jgi:hypothetical protein
MNTSTSDATPSSGLPASLPYGLLSAEHPAGANERGYTPALWRELDLLHRGGYAIQAAAAQFLPKAVGESQARHKERLSLAAYIGYFGQIAGVYSASLFAQPVSITPAGDADDPNTPGELPDPGVYEDFARNADLRGGSFVELLRRVANSGLVKGKALVGIDFPAAPAGFDVVTKADSDRLGLARPYAFLLEPEELIDWEHDEVVRRRVELDGGGSVEFEVGRFAWAVLRRIVARRPSPTESRPAPVEEFKIWSRGDDGVVRWAVYRTPPQVDGKPLRDEDPVAKVDEGATRFCEIPIVEITIPDALWLGNVIGPLNKEHWQRRSALLAAQQRSLLVIPVVKLGPEIGGVHEAMPAERAQDPSRGDDPVARYTAQGYVVLGDKDTLDFAAPPTEAFTIVDKQLEGLVDEIHRVSGRMAASISSTANAVGRSGASKAIDRADFTTVLMALGAIFRDGARRIYEVIAGARNEDVAWTVHGLDAFEGDVDRAALIEEALQLSAIEIPSRTWRVEQTISLALKLQPGMDPATRAQVSKEIAAAIPDEDDGKLPTVPDEDNVDEPPGSQREPTDVATKEPT